MNADRFSKVQAWGFWLMLAIAVVNSGLAIYRANIPALFGWLCTAMWVNNTHLAQKERDSYKRLCDRLLEQSANPNTRPQGRTATRNAEGRQPERRRRF